MHYYKKNIGDYHKKAGRLSMLEHGAYTLLIDACYDRERFPTEDEAIEWTWARTQEEEAAVRFVLARFFDLRDGVYVQARIEEEIAKYHANAETNARIAKEREDKRRNGARTVLKASPGVHEAPPNQEPITNNQEPISKPITSEQSPDSAAKKKTGSPEDYDAAKWIFERVQKLDPTAKDPNWASWANDIRLMREIDGRDHQAIHEMFDWANRHHFWCRNILSPGKLREKWGTLAVQKNGPDRSAPASRSAMNRIGIDSQTPEGWGDGSDL
jgi:uncharacterized protein YdaU (DUF1376 family)